MFWFRVCIFHCFLHLTISHCIWNNVSAVISNALINHGFIPMCAFESFNCFLFLTVSLIEFLTILKSNFVETNSRCIFSHSFIAWHSLDSSFLSFFHSVAYRHCIPFALISLFLFLLLDSSMRTIFYLFIIFFCSFLLSPFCTDDFLLLAFGC